MTEIPRPPEGDEMRALLADTKVDLLRRVARSRSSRRRRRTRIVGASVVGIIACGGLTTAAATGLFGGVEATNTKAADVDLGKAPKGSTYVEVTLNVTCQDSAKYGLDLDHQHNPASVECGKRDDGRPAQLSWDFELPKGRTSHVITVSTNRTNKYTVHAFFRTGLTENQRLNAAREKLEEQRSDNARTVKRTDKVPSSDPYEFPAKWPDPYYVNENGMTIGTFDRDTTPYDQWPDLMPSEGPHGEHAFTYSGKRGFVVKDPDEAVAYMRWMVRSGQIDPIKKGRWSKTYTIFLAEDGKTVLAKEESGSMRED